MLGFEMNRRWDDDPVHRQAHIAEFITQKARSTRPPNFCISPEPSADRLLSLALEANLTAVVEEAKHLISGPAFFPDSSSSDPLKLQGAKDIIQAC
ncbi:hypothetical protein M0R45_020072 [Rubus argutus]|uniref:Uncharacterized protein n=1 Tax=Rubus argutus TaxID=59490 RepID=A0AAW1XAV6_RUBAR